MDTVEKHFLELLASFSLSVLSVMQGHILKAPRFVSKSIFATARDVKVSMDSTDSVGDEQTGKESRSMPEEARLVQNRRRVFIVEECSELGQVFLLATEFVSYSLLVIRNVCTGPVMERKTSTEKHTSIYARSPPSL